MKEIFRRISFTGGGGQLPLLSATTPVVEGYVVTLLPETPGTRVPVQIPDGYPGTKIPESPSTRPDGTVQAKDNKWPAEASIISRLIKQTGDIDISYTGRIVSKNFLGPH